MVMKGIQLLNMQPMTLTAEDMIPDDEMVLTISHQGYIKRTALIEYRTQGREE